MKIFVISLKWSNDRRSVMSEQMERLGLAFEFIDGVDGRMLSDEEISELYDKRWTYRQEGRYFTPSEIGCYASHLRTYQKIVDDKIPYALILEDDAWLTPSIVGVLKAMEEKISADMNGVFLMQELGPGNFKKKGKTIPVADLYILKEINAAMWAHAYVVTHTSAYSLISALTPISHVSDSWGWVVRHRVASVYCMNRTLSTQNVYDLKSVIGFERFTRDKWLFDFFIHKAYRAFWLGYDMLLSLKKKLR